MKLFAIFVLIFTSTTYAFAQIDQPVSLSCSHSRVVRSEIRTLEEGDPWQLTTTPVNQLGEHIEGLKPADFRINKGKKIADIVRMEELTSIENTVMRITLMVDNSQTMSPHLELLETTMDDVLSRFSDAVRVSVLFFSETESASPAFSYAGRALPLVRLPYTYDKPRAIRYAKNMLAERLLTRKTYLYDGVYGAIQQISADTGKVDGSFAIILSDGKDNASSVEPEFVLGEVKKGTQFYTIDYLTEANKFLVDLAKVTGGEHFQATNAEELSGIFDAIANKIVARGYGIQFRFKPAPKASIGSTTRELVMKEEIVRETFPLLNYVFFDQGSAAIPQRYVALSSKAVAGFDEAAIEGGAIDFYYNMLNVFGGRLNKESAATITVKGYINNTGDEKRNSRLAEDRAKIVKSYLTSVWGIEDHRIVVSGEGLPPLPSSSKEEEGRQENSRVEISSENWEIMKPVTFVRRIASVQPPEIVFSTSADAAEGLASWLLTVEQNGKVFDTRRGSELPPSMTWNWKNRNGELPASSGSLSYSLLVKDNAGDADVTVKSTVDVREERSESIRNISTSADGITTEKISLILFPFNVSTPGERNQVIMNEYVYPRITAGSRITVSGYTDKIGTEEYNQKLSEGRAEEVFKIIREGSGTPIPEDMMTWVGLGETSPLFTNEMPEGRFYNRTVSLLIERLP